MSFLNSQEFNVAQKAMDILEKERRALPVGEDANAMDKEKVHDFIVQSLQEQGIEVTEEKVSSALEKVFGPTSLNALMPVKPQEQKLEKGHITFNGPLSVEDSSLIQTVLFNHIVSDESTLHKTVIQHFESKVNYFHKCFKIDISMGISSASIMLLVSLFSSQNSLSILLFCVWMGLLSMATAVSIFCKRKNKKLVQEYSKISNYEKLMKSFLKISSLYKDTNYSRSAMIHDSLFGPKSRNSSFVDFEHPKIKRILEAYSKNHMLDKIWSKWMSYGKPISKYEFFILYETLGRSVYLPYELKELAFLKLELEKKAKIKREILDSNYGKKRKDFSYLLYKNKMKAAKYADKYNKDYLKNPFYSDHLKNSFYNDDWK